MTYWDTKTQRHVELPEGTHQVLSSEEATQDEYGWVRSEYFSSAPRTPRRNEVNRRTRGFQRGEEG